MILSEIFSIKHTALFLILCVCLSGCAGPGKAVSEGEEVPPSLEVLSLRPDQTSPLVARRATIQWEASASGGEGGHIYEFWLGSAKGESLEQKGRSPVWDWSPQEAGSYQVKVLVRDGKGRTAEGSWPSPFEILPELVVTSLMPDKTSPQTAQMSSVRWTATAQGGAGELSYGFRYTDGKKVMAVQRGPSPVFDWMPDEPGTYRIKAAVQDSMGHVAETAWSRPFEITPQLLFKSLEPDKASPQAARMAVIRWSAAAEGGAGNLTYEFLHSDGTKEIVVQKGLSPTWDWAPEKAGTYQTRVIVRDLLGHQVESGWSPEYDVAPELLLDALSFDKTPPQSAVMTTIRWTVGASGGVGEYINEFRVSDGHGEAAVQTGPSSEWDWTPDQEGIYRIQVVVKDAIGNTVESEWSPDYRVVPELVAESLMPDKISPQAAGMTKIRWTTRASGGVGRLTYVFKLYEGKEEVVMQEGFSPAWDWSPQKAGAYRMKVIVRDDLSNSKEQDWPDAYEVAPELVLQSLVPDKQGPLASGKTTVHWSVSVTGGVGALSYEFIRFNGSEEAVLQAGPSPTLEWKPDKPGIYKIKVVVRDELGNQVESGWSEEFEIVTKLVTGSLVAVYPFENYNLRPVPVREIRESYMNKLKSAGLEILPEDVLEKFMARHRIRHTGGVTRVISEALREETGAEGLVITALEFYDDGPPPIIAMTSRLVSTGKDPEILWMQSVGLSGDDARGLLDLGRIKDPGVLRNKAEQILSDSLHDYLAEWREPGPREVEKRFSPKVAYRSPLVYPERRYTVAVVPFFNRSQRDYAGEIMTLQFVEKLRERKRFEVLDPGEVRQRLLGYRIIMYDGLSLGDADLLFEFLDVDLIVTGNVLDYQDAPRGAGKPKVDFSAVMIERESREVVWSSKNYNQGDDQVFFFDWGKMRTANAMASGMVRAVVDEMVRPE